MVEALGNVAETPRIDWSDAAKESKRLAMRMRCPNSKSKAILLVREADTLKIAHRFSGRNRQSRNNRSPRRRRQNYLKRIDSVARFAGSSFLAEIPQH